VGAGNSPFSEAMYAEGYKHITNIDFSEIVVEDMQLKYKNNGYEPSLKCTPLPIQTSSATCAP
jgi:2-polyprenyl-3-methyl-5-hydroxy-6-metoxy-1,4-benzoquinol methylase